MKPGNRVRLNEPGKGYFGEERLGVILTQIRNGDAYAVQWDGGNMEVCSSAFLEPAVSDLTVNEFQAECDKLGRKLIETALSGSSRLVSITSLVGALAATAKEGSVPLEGVIQSLTGVWGMLE